jgi:hypothetical protein
VKGGRREVKKGRKRGRGKKLGPTASFLKNGGLILDGAKNTYFLDAGFACYYGFPPCVSVRGEDEALERAGTAE